MGATMTLLGRFLNVCRYHAYGHQAARADEQMAALHLYGTSKRDVLATPVKDGPREVGASGDQAAGTDCVARTP